MKEKEERKERGKEYIWKGKRISKKADMKKKKVQ